MSVVGVSDGQRGRGGVAVAPVDGGTGAINDSPAGLVVSRTRILLGMSSRRSNVLEFNMLTLTLQAGALFSNGFE